MGYSASFHLPHSKGNGDIAGNQKGGTAVKPVAERNFQPALTHWAKIEALSIEMASLRTNAILTVASLSNRGSARDSGPGRAGGRVERVDSMLSAFSFPQTICQPSHAPVDSPAPGSA